MRSSVIILTEIQNYEVGSQNFNFYKEACSFGSRCLIIVTLNLEIMNFHVLLTFQMKSEVQTNLTIEIANKVQIIFFDNICLQNTVIVRIKLSVSIFTFKLNITKKTDSF